jgi:hypothetical protein
LHLDKIIESKRLGILRQINKDGLGKSFEVVLYTVLHDVVDVNNQLLEFCKALMDVVKVTINVH